MLGLFFGVACTLDPDGRIQATSESWDELMGRTGKADLLRNAIQGKPFLDLLPADDEVKAAFCFALASVAEGKQNQHVQLVEFKTASKPFSIQFVFHAIRDDDHLTGYVVQGLDSTHETVNRMALLDREHRLRELKATCEHLSGKITGLTKSLEAKAADHESAVSGLVRTFAHEPREFGKELCRLAAEECGAMFATLATFSPSRNCFHFTAHHNAPDFHQFAIDADTFELAPGEGPAGIAVHNGCATKFDHLLEREDFAKWVPLAQQYGYNCIWAWPLEDQDGLYGALQLFFPDLDKLLTVEQCSVLTALCQNAIPLLRVSDQWATFPTCKHEVCDAPRHENFRALAAGLSEEFSNLLTGVLGYSSLAVAEIGNEHAALGDIHSIEKAARDAARLTRRLLAICGPARKATSPVDLRQFVKHHVERDRANFFPDGPAEVAVCDYACPARADAAALEVMLDGMAEHARMAMNGGIPVWSLSTEENTTRLTLTYSGVSSEPIGWKEGALPTHANQIPEIFFAREAARNLAGDIVLTEGDGTTAITLSLPLASVSART